MRNGSEKAKKSGPDDSVLYDDALVARAAGVKRRFVDRWIRYSGVRGRDWTCLGGQVALTREGARRAVWGVLGVSCEVSLEGCVFVKKNGAVRVRVWRKPVNRKVMTCQRVDREELVRVSVADSEPYRIGDEFDAMDERGELVKYGGWPEKGW